MITRLPGRLKRLAALALLVTLNSAASADTIFGLYAGANLWQPQVDGTFGETDNSFDFTSEFDGGESDANSYYFAVEHFIPMVPNFMVRSTPVNWSGRSEDASGTLAGVITIEGDVDASLDVDMIDATGYYELLDNWITVDLGVTARMLDGFAAVSGTSDLLLPVQDRVELSQTVPMLYGHLRLDLPFSGLAFGVRGNGIDYESNNLIDLEAYLHLEVDLIPTIDFGIQGGVRRLSIKIDDVDNWSSDATLQGAYVGLTAHF